MDRELVSKWLFCGCGLCCANRWAAWSRSMGSLVRESWLKCSERSMFALGLCSLWDICSYWISWWMVPRGTGWWANALPDETCSELWEQTKTHKHLGLWNNTIQLIFSIKNLFKKKLYKVCICTFMWEWMGFNQTNSTIENIGGSLNVIEKKKDGQDGWIDGRMDGWTNEQM